MHSDNKKKITSSARSPVDLWRLIGGRTKKVDHPSSPKKDGLLAVYQDRVTYTFIFGREVASIHFDLRRGEIFFKGHNIRNMTLKQEQKEELIAFKGVLKGDDRGAIFFTAYDATLEGILADNSNRSKK